jgi:LuxR family glucitol operon transcriptional activator
MSQSQYFPARLGEQIAHLIDALALAKNLSKKQTMAELEERTGYTEATTYRWRQGRLCPPDETIEILLQLGKEEANLNRNWGESLLHVARHSDPDRLVNKIWGPKAVRLIPNNLPPPAHTAFVGRRTEIIRLLELLSSGHAAHLITVDGIGGVGKTTLVLEAAYRCLRASTGEMPNANVPSFDAIIFASAKQDVLTPYGILARYQAQRTLRDIFREIADTLDRLDITGTTPDDQPNRVRQALARQHTLLIVDNLETMQDKQEIIAFLYDLPPQIKVIITTRERALFSPIRLEHLSEADGLRLIHHETQDKGVQLEDEQAMALYRRTGGVPAAIVYAVGQLANGYSVEGTLARMVQATGDVARFCFSGSVTPLRGQPAHRLLMALAMFPKRPLREAVIHVAGLRTDPIAADDGLAQLQCLSLVSQSEGVTAYSL